MSDLAALADRIAGLERPLLVALDVDGTLAPIVSDPSRASVPRDTAASLEALRAIDGVVVALVTGRDAAQLERMIAIEGAWRVVEHGGAVLGPGEPRPRELELGDRGPLLAFEAWAAQHLGARGARIEEKRGSIVIHARELAARDAEASAAILAEARDAASRAGLFPREGRHVLEAQLEPADKGSALRALIARAGAASVVYAGDDRTDEPAIAVASERGVGIFVRSEERPESPPGASAVLDGPREVAALLARLIDRLRA